MDNEKTDALILEACSGHFTKIAVIIAKVYDDFEGEGLELTETLAKEIAERVYILVDHGRLECNGNMRRWRESDVKLIQNVVK